MKDETVSYHIIKLEILAAARRSVQRCSKHKNLTKKVFDHIKAELPNYQTFFEISDKKMPRGINVLMVAAPPALTFRVVYHNNPNVHWSELFLEAIERADDSDHLERIQQEKKEIYSDLSKMSDEIYSLIEDAKSYAIERVKRLPVPQSSTIRKNDSCWEEPSDEMKKAFPILFGK